MVPLGARRAFARTEPNSPSDLPERHYPAENDGNGRSPPSDIRHVVPARSRRQREDRVAGGNARVRGLNQATPRPG